MTVDYKVYITTEAVLEDGRWWTIQQAALELWTDVPRSFLDLFVRDYDGHLFDDSQEENEISLDCYGKPLKAISIHEFMAYASGLEEGPPKVSPREYEKMMMLKHVAQAYDALKQYRNFQVTYLVLYAH